MTGSTRRRSTGRRWTVVTVAILLAYLFPIFWMLSASFQPGANSANVTFLPTDPGLDGYARVLTSGGLDGLRVSVVASLGAVVLTLLIAVPAGYALSRVRSRVLGVAQIVVLVAQMIPSIVLANSFYSMFNDWGVLNSFAGLILADATLGVPFAIILLRSFMLRLDQEVVEASTLDGLGPLGVLVRIVVPLSRNAVITAAVFTFLFSWGDLLFGLTLVTQDQMYPVTVFIYSLTQSQLTTWAAVMAASLIASLPALVVVLAAQRYVKAGLALGSSR
ncbi:carbohydrate ABC transporter permease [uncultured Amnibacterium sp.]|uniref:carbohydrate ABC transporter permease n=1 Tax=uncultured Amnibacterium sp. TaxID=1631851 RepID=UPI0035CB5D66